MTELGRVFRYNIKNMINEEQFEKLNFTKTKSFDYKKSFVYKNYKSQTGRKFFQNTCPIN